MTKKIFQTLIIIYLSLFLITCSSSKPPIPIEQARVMESREYYVNQKDLMKSSLNVIQDMYYTVNEINMDLGIIVASKISEGEQAETRKEPQRTDETPLWKKILTGAVITAIVVGFILLITDLTDDNNDRNNNHDHNNLFFGSNDNNGNTVYTYKITINFDELDNNHTKIRINATGEESNNGNIVRTGPVQEPKFFEHFFNNLNSYIR